MAASLPPHTFIAPAVQVPPWHVSGVHLLPSRSQPVPSVLLGGVPQLPVPGSHVALLWHASAPPHTVAVPAVQVPLWHVSGVHLLASRSQLVPLVLLGGVPQVPVLGLQVALLWHASAPPQVIVTGPVTQTPLWQVSAVHLLPFSQPDPSDFAGFVHMPVAESHVPALWHWSLAVHVTGVPLHVPLWHTSPVVQLLPSLHVAALFVCMQPFARSQLSSVHGLLSLQEMALLEQAPFMHVPVATWHMSVTVQALPSLFWQLPVALHAWQAPHALIVQQKPSVQNAPATH
jgi:hypothetical protein